MQPDSHSPTDVIVIGGGLSGLTASLLLARGGKRVTLVERAPQLGGRALTQHQDGYSLNLGPHALYRGGHALRVLKQLGIQPRGGLASTRGVVGRGTELFQLPAGPGALLTTRLLDGRNKAAALRFFASLLLKSPRDLTGMTVSNWLQPMDPDLRQLIAIFLRLTSYANAPERQDAGAALRQLTMAVRSGTMYVDGGWQSMVEALATATEQAGVTLRTGRVARILHAERVQGVLLTTGETIAAETVVLTTSPGQAATLLEGEARRRLQHWSEALIPVKAACMDLALSRLPRPETRFALGIDRPWYLSEHSGTASLAPAGGAVVHAAWYVDPDRPEQADMLERELEAVLDRLQPGWRQWVIRRRFMPSLTVTNALDTPAGRPASDAAGVSGLYLAGDWVGPHGMLADAGLASAERAATLILASPAPGIHPVLPALS